MYTWHPPLNVTLVTGPNFNKALKAMSNYNTATTVNFTNEPATGEQIANGTLVSDTNSIAKAYMYALDDTTINISPIEEDIKIYANSDCFNMFYDCSKLTTLDLSNFDTSKVTNMSSMFCYCSKLTSLDLSSFDTSKVTNMNGMFQYCNSLTTLDLSNFNTSKVTNMIEMFQYCYKLTTLDVSNFDTSKVTNMRYMFYYCKALTTLDLSNFDTSKVTNMEYMFCYCSKLTTLDVSNFDTSNVTNMRYMFSSCKALTTLDLSNFNTSNVTNMRNMFYKCSKLISSIKISSTTCTDYSGMFNNCSTTAPAEFIVYYTSDESVEDLVDLMIATKSSTSNISKQLAA